MAGYLGSVPVPQATQHRESFTCTEGQTSFATAGYTAQFVDVYLNGSHLSPADFTATNGSDVVLAVAASADDVCDIISYTPFEVASQTFTGTTTMTDVVAASLDISGNIDIDGTTNLDAVDIDGAVDMASTLGVTGVVTANAGVVVDNFTLDGTTLALSTGSMKLEAVGGDILLDASTGDIKFQDDGVEIGKIRSTNSNLNIFSSINDKDIVFSGIDNSGGINALTLDMSDAGAARFVNGTAALPAVSFISDPNTGMLSGGADNLSFSTGGTIRAFLSATQLNVTGNAIFGGSAHTFAGSGVFSGAVDCTEITYDSVSGDANHGLNVVRYYSLDTDDATSLGSDFNNRYTVLYVTTTNGITALPMYPNAGSGVAWQVRIFDPDNLVFRNNQVDWTQAGSSGNTFQLIVNSGSGGATIQRTGGALAYQVYLSRVSGGTA